MSDTARQRQSVIRSIADETKKVAYLGAAGPYVILGDQVLQETGFIVAIALSWFIICQCVAHLLLALADRMEAAHG